MAAEPALGVYWYVWDNMITLRVNLQLDTIVTLTSWHSLELTGLPR